MDNISEALSPALDMLNPVNAVDSIINSLFEPLTENGVCIFNIIVFCIVVLVAWGLGKVVASAVKRRLPDSVDLSNRESLGKLITAAFIIFGIIAGLPNLKIDLSGLFVVGGMFAIVIGLATQNIFSNGVSGVILFLERPVKIGDEVEVGGISGTVRDIQFLSTIVRTYEGISVRIPNSSMFTANIKNYFINSARRFEYIVGITYDDDADRAKEIIRRVVDEHPFALKKPAPAIYVSELNDSSVDITVRIWAPSVNWLSVKMDLLWRIKLALEDEGIEMPFPQSVVWFPQELNSKVTISTDKNGEFDSGKICSMEEYKNMKN